MIRIPAYAERMEAKKAAISREAGRQRAARRVFSVKERAALMRARHAEARELAAQGLGWQDVAAQMAIRRRPLPDWAIKRIVLGVGK
jgi:glutamate synthase domain-containing protein 1